MSRTLVDAAASRGLVLVALLAFVGTAAADDADLEWIDRDAIEAGEIAVRTSIDSGTVTVDTAALIDAPPQAIWAVLTACEDAPEFVPNVLACERIERLEDGRAELFVQTIKPIFFIPRFDYVFRLDYTPYERIDMTRISGAPVHRMAGTWRFLRQTGGAVLLVHHFEVEPAVPIPRFMVRATLRRDLTKTMEALRERVEGRVDGRADASKN
ncbi:MAG: SRPBCC family protein [Gammaproteobacteria bacterium]|nr:hypothetical protein [Gammaproteobacteria bacterium]